MADLDFVHLHVHSSYSLLEGALHHRAARRTRQSRPAAGARAHRHRQHVRRAGIFRKARRLRHPADRRLRAGGRFRRHRPRAAHRDAQPQRTRIVLLAARETGYRSLMRLNSRAFLETPANEPPRLKLEWLEGETAGHHRAYRRPGRSARYRNCRRAKPSRGVTRSTALQRLFGDRLYVELQRHGTPAERARRAGID